MPSGVDLDKLEALRARLDAEMEANDTISWRATMDEYEEALDMAAPSLLASARDLAELLAAQPRCGIAVCRKLATREDSNCCYVCDDDAHGAWVEGDGFNYDLPTAGVIRRRDATE